MGRILNRPSLSTRLLLVTVAVMACVAGLLGWAAVGAGYMAEDAMARSQLALVRRADQEARAVGAMVPDPGPWIRIIDNPHTQTPDLAEVLQKLAPGIHEWSDGQREFMIAVEVEESGARRWYLYDQVPVDREDTESLRLWAVAGLIGLALLAGTAVLGLVLTRWLVAPLRELRDRVATRSVHDAVSLADGLPRDEIGDLAAAFDRHHCRIRDLLAREQSFARDASHELRTPLTVMGGALELLANEPQTPRGQRCLARLQRAQAGMRRQVEAFLILAREPSPDELETIDLRSALADAVERTQWLFPGCHEPLIPVYAGDAVPVIASPLAVGIVLDNVLRNALQHHTDSGVEVRLDGPCLTVANACSMEPVGAPGIGLSIIEGLCRRCGWEFSTRIAAGRFSSQVSFAPGAAISKGHMLLSFHK